MTAVLKPGKYRGVAFTAEQNTARKRWQRAQSMRVQLAEGLRTAGTIDRRRAALHRRLDQVLDIIERSESEARAEFPDVAESFTIATIVGLNTTRRG